MGFKIAATARFLEASKIGGASTTALPLWWTGSLQTPIHMSSSKPQQNHAASLQRLPVQKPALQEVSGHLSSVDDLCTGQGNVADKRKCNY